MSLDFKKRDYSVTTSPQGTPPGKTKESALSMLLEKSKETNETNAQPNLSLSVSPGTVTGPGIPSGTPTATVFTETPDTPTYAQSSRISTIANSIRSSAIPVGSTTEASSVRIPSSSHCKSSYAQSSLQQQRERALTSDFNTPTSSMLGTSAGYGHLFGAGEIGNVSSPRHYANSTSRDSFDPSSVEERFVVNFPQAAVSLNSNSSSTMHPDLRIRSRANSVSSVNRLMSKVSLSRSSSKSSVSSFASLRRFIDKPWKNDDPGSPSMSRSPHSPVGVFVSRSRKSSVASFHTGDDDGLSFTASSTNHQADVGTNGTVMGISSPSPASLSQLDDAYATQQGQSERRRQTLKSFGKLGKTLGEGAGGHVKIIRSNTDSKIYAVKEFRARHHSESQREYNKKVGAEYCLGLTLKHPNIVNTIDIIYETDKVYQVMEYAAYDLFAIVMSGKMTSGEIMCDFRQLMNGIRYLHNSGLAHRDLKLDNCVVSEQGIVKIIDFGSSVVFRYPESDKIYGCDGVVGSDPYLAPEAAGKGRYVPPATDIWSAAIVLCCVMMRKFPWKAPRLSDRAFKAFVKVEDDGSRPGLAKLLSSLPPETHELFTGMLDLNPETRFDINQCWENELLTRESFCTLKGRDELVPAPGHHHTSVSFDEAHIALLEKKNRKAKKSEKMW